MTKTNNWMRDLRQADDAAKNAMIEASEQLVLPPFAKELSDLPGELGNIQAHIVNRMTYVDVPLSGFTALATLTPFAQPRITVASGSGLALNEYYMALLPTGFGKNDLRQPMQLLKDRSKPGGYSETTTFYHSAPSSAQGMHVCLENSRCAMMLSDEFAGWLESSRSGDYKKQARDYLLEAYTAHHGTIQPNIAATKTYDPVERPRLSIFATSTAEAVFEAMTGSDASKGNFNRWLYYVGDATLPQKRYEGLEFEPDDHIVDFITWVRSVEPTVMPFTADGWARYKDMDSALLEPIKANENLLGGRLGEHAIKMMALLALSSRRLEINAQDVEQAINITLSLYHRAKAYADHIGSLDDRHATGTAIEQLAQAIERKNFIYISQLENFSRQYKKLSSGEKESVIRHLIISGIAVKSEKVLKKPL